MKIKSSICIKAPVAEIWEIIKNPANMPAWNEKCVECNADENVHLGSKFEARFAFGKKHKDGLQATCEIVEFKPCEKLTVRYSGEVVNNKDRFVDETFFLIYKGPQKTKLKRQVDLSNSHLPLWLKCFMWFLTTFGYQVGPSMLEGIEDLLKYK